jgi:ATP-dependent DNA ligase
MGGSDQGERRIDGLTQSASLAQASAPRVLYSEHFEDGPALYAQAAKLGLEGVVSKRADAPYHAGSATVSW